MSDHGYENLQNISHSFSWICYKCGCPNFSSSLFATASLDLSNPFSVLDSASELDCSDVNLNHPLTSTPTDPTSKARPRFQTPKNRRHGLKAMIINCNGLKSARKQAAFHSTVEHHNPDIILGCESKIDGSIPTYSIFPAGYTVYRKDRDVNGGGVFVATKDTLISVDLPNLDSNSEIIWASLQFAGSKPLFISSYYGPQVNDGKAKSVSINELASSVAKLMGNNQRSQPNIIIGGDFNYPDIDWQTWRTTKASTAPIHGKFIDFLLENSLAQLQWLITRPVSNSVLDLIVTSCPQLISNVEVLPGISDHLVVMFDVNMKSKPQPKIPRKIFNYNKTNLETLQEKTKHFCEEFLASDPGKNSVNTNWTTVKDNLHQIMNSHIPFKMSKTRHSLPWIDPQIKRQMRKRDRLYVKAKKSNVSRDWSLFKQHRNKLAKTVHQAHMNYVNNVVGASLHEKPKTFWSYVKLMKTENLGIPALRSQTKLCTTDVEKAQALNEQFQSVFTPKSSEPVTVKPNSPFPSIPDIHIHPDGVAKQLNNLNPSKASGPDELPPRFLKLVADDLAPALCFLFQQSITTGQLPDEWGKAIVSPIYKKGTKSDPANYRPISLTCLCCKVLEHIVLSHMAKHLSQHRIILDSQHGFRERLSTVTQLITSVNDWSTTLEHRGQSDVILLDFSKAFDRVSHHHLSAKLNYYGIRGSTLSWINAFLSNRFQAVSVNGRHSTWVEVTSGVPQGSVLGPALFLLYINDIQDHITSRIRLFSDDSIVYREINSPEDHDALQQDLQALADWSKTWLMEFNIKKCAVLSITRKKKPSIHQYSIHGEVLGRVDEHDYLGVTISNDLRWNKHCQQVIKKSNQTLGLLRRTLAPCHKDVKVRAYESLVRPRLEYASEVWNPYTTSMVDRLEESSASSCKIRFC